MSLYEIENFGIPSGYDIRWQITSFIVVFLLFRLVYNTELDLDSMTQKEKINHYLCLVLQVIFALSFLFLFYLI